jgi:hypothetical protein
MMFWRLYGGRKFSGGYRGGRFEYDSYTNYTFRAGIHPGRPNSEHLNAPSPNANTTGGEITIYTRRTMAVANENGEGDFVRWEGRYYRIQEEKRHGILLPHNRYIAVLADLPVAGLEHLVDIFAAIYGNGVVDGTGAFQVGAELTLTAIPDAGWEFDYWFRGDEEDLRVETPSYTFRAPERGLTIECHFKKLEGGGLNDVELLTEDEELIMSELDELITSG